MKILHIVSALNTGGIETWLLNIVKRNTDEIEHHFCLLNSPQDGMYDREFRENGCTLHRCPTKQPGLVNWRFVSSLIDSQNIDIIHSHVYTASFYYSILGSIRKIPVVAHSHNSKPFGGLTRKLYGKIARTIINTLATERFACSREAAFSLYGTYDQIKIIPYGIDPAEFSPKRHSRKENGKMTTLRIGHIGRFVPQKNHEFILSIAKALKTKNAGHQIICIGDGPIQASVAAEITSQSLANMKVKDAQNHVGKYYTDCFDLFILPSLYEGLGIVALEAQCSGLQVIASNFVPDDACVSDSIFTKLPLEVDLWVEAICNVKVPTYEEKIRRNRLFLDSKYTINNSSAVLTKFYLKVLQKNKNTL